MTARATLAGAITFTGVGLHNGLPTRLTVRSATGGLTLVHRGARIPAIPQNVTAVNRSTSLGPVSTVEHALSALAGLGITDAELVCDAAEFPAFDGSAASMAQALARIGTEPVPGDTPVLPHDAVIALGDGAARIEVRAGTGNWCYTYDRAPRWPRRQAACVRLLEDYLTDVAPARTIVTSDELAWALASGLGKGLRAEDVVVIGQSGYETPVRFDDEPARHKLLDLIGDLSLSGVSPADLDVIATRGGHRLHVQAAAALGELSSTASAARSGQASRLRHTR